MNPNQHPGAEAVRPKPRVVAIGDSRTERKAMPSRRRGRRSPVCARADEIRDEARLCAQLAKAVWG